MAQLLAWADAVDIGYGRGRLAREAAASLRRVDRAFGRAVDINEAWRSPEQANANYARYQAYLRDPRINPWAPIALPADQSIHCRGYAVDTDDTSDAQIRVWNDHGWYWTVYRNGVLVERWHLEYFRDRDNHRNDPAPADAGQVITLPKGPLMALSDEEQEELLNNSRQVYNAFFAGGPSMDDAGRSAAFSLGNITVFLDRIDQRILSIYQAVFDGGPSMPDGDKSIGASLAEIREEIAALRQVAGGAAQGS